MKTRHLFLMAFLFSLMMPCEAQINLNKLGKQIKKSAESQVEQKVKEKAARETRNALDKTEDKLDQGVQNAVSKATDKAADTPVGAAVQGVTESVSGSDSQSSGNSSQSSSSVVPDQGEPDPYIGVPIGENVLEAYKKLDVEVYYTTRYEYEPRFFYESAAKSKPWLDAELGNFMVAMQAGADGIPVVIRNEGGQLVPCGEHTLNAYFALFSVLPKAAYPVFLQARVFLKAIADGTVNTDVSKKEVIVMEMKEENGKIESYWKPSNYLEYGRGFPIEMIYDPFDQYKGNRLKRWKDEEAKLMKIYRDKVPFENVKSTVINYLVAAANATKAKDWYSASWLSYYLDIAVKDMKEHPNKVEDEDYTFAVQTYEKMAADNFPKWRAEMTREWKEQYAGFAQKSGGGPAAIPKAAMSDPKLEAEMIAIAKGIYDDGRVPVKAVIKYADWNYTRNALGQIIDRYHTAYIIFKMKDGTHRMVDIGFKQLYNGSSYGKTQLRGIGLLNQAVDYK